MISGVILARNEERNIVDCIVALRPHVSELILIDMESEDATVALARPLVNRILSHELIANFDVARNIAISEVSNLWLWFVDADERVSETTGKLVNELVRRQGDQFEAINIPFKTHFCGKWMQHSGWWPGYTMPRVLKRGHFRFSERLHGGVELSGREVRIAPDPKLGVDHFSYRSIEHYVDKINRYTSTEALQLREAGQSVDWRNAIAHMMHDLWMYYEQNQGQLDGRHGWLLAWLSGQYRWLSHAKLLDLDPDPREPTAELFPRSLGDVLSEMEQELERLRNSRPLLPLGIVWRTPVWDSSGYADEGRCIAKALSLNDRDVVLETIPWSDSVCDISAQDGALFRAMQRSKRGPSNLTITNCIPTLVTPDRAAALNVIRTTFETDRIPNHWNSHLDQFDEVWVISKHNESAFIRSGIAPEKIRRVPSFLDTDLYRPDGDKIDLPESLGNRFVFLSVFEWQFRKGWDLLLKAYCQTFSISDGAGLLLKVSRGHGQSLDNVRKQASEFIESIGQSLSERRDIEIIDASFSAMEMARLYRSVDVFVLPSRGEGWGRPFMEAMATGLPTIGTGASGNLDFMNDENSNLVPATVVNVPLDAVNEIPVYAGSKWFEPDSDKLGQAMQLIVDDVNLRSRIAKNALAHIQSNHGMAAGKSYWQDAIEAAEQRFVRPSLPEPRDSQIRVVWEGEFFAGHSFSNINEQLAKLFMADQKFAFAIDRKVHNPTSDRASPMLGRFASHMNRRFEQGPQVVVRHAFPPNWIPPECGHWIHIQPWEFGHLPQEWVEPLRDSVDEIWVPSQYVKNVYVDSGIPPAKIQVIPWGVDLGVFQPTAPSRILPTNKSFRFLFVGGTIERKGFDRLLQAYVEEFSPEDDVCLVIKDLGADTFYRFGNQRKEIRNACDNPGLPEILYFDDQWTPGQLASLYTACNCLVMPYRGEGFGLPILEGMACGLPAIVPVGGPSDDFAPEETAYLLPSRVVQTQHEWKLCGPALEFQIEMADLRILMRRAFKDQTECRNKGLAAANHVRNNFSWQRTARLMCDRMMALVGDKTVHTSTNKQRLPASIVACVLVENDERIIADCLARLAPYVAKIVVLDGGCRDRSAAIAREYGATVHATIDETIHSLNQSGDWLLFLRANERVDSDNMETLGQSLAQIDSDTILAVEFNCKTSGGRDADTDDRLEPRLLRCQKMILGSISSRPLASLVEIVDQLDIETICLKLSLSGSSEAPFRLGAGRQSLIERWLIPYVPAKGRIFVDVGANVGIWTKCLASHFEHVHAIEPNPAAIPGLKSELPSNVTVHEIGAWSEEFRGTFSVFGGSEHLSLYFRDEGINTGQCQGQVTLPCRTIDSLAIEGCIDFIKCDVEGAEIEALQGAREIILRDRPWLLVEVHSIDNFRQLTRLLYDWEYLFTVIRDPHYEPFSRLWHSHCWFSCQSNGSFELAD